MTEARPVTLITGASAGIGTALAHEFARHGHDLLLIARREKRLNELADAIAAQGHRRPIVLAADLERTDAVDCVGDMLTLHGVEPEIVVNNAGFGLVGMAAELDRSEQLAMIDVNVRALTALSVAWVDSLKRHKGGILNVASVAGFLPGPGMAVYYATKAYVVSFSEALHYELARHGVRVTALCPGPVPTEFQDRAGVKNKAYPALLMRTAEQMAEAGYRGLKDGRRLVIPGFANQLVALVGRMAPRALVLAAISRHQKSRMK